MENMSAIINKPFTIDECELPYTICPICREIIGTTKSKIIDTHIYTRLSCRQHVFHLECITRWLGIRMCCPLCNYTEDGKNLTVHLNLPVGEFLISIKITSREYYAIQQEIRKCKEQCLDSDTSHKKLLSIFEGTTNINKLSRDIFESFWSIA